MVKLTSKEIGFRTALISPCVSLLNQPTCSNIFTDIMTHKHIIHKLWNTPDKQLKYLTCLTCFLVMLVSRKVSAKLLWNFVFEFQSCFLERSFNKSMADRQTYRHIQTAVVLVPQTILTYSVILKWLNMKIFYKE